MVFNLESGVLKSKRQHLVVVLESDRSHFS